MPRAREGQKSQAVEMAVEVWAMLSALSLATGVSMQLLLEDAARRYCAKPPKKLPAPRKPGPKPKAAE
jgi:hypothetical protein